MPRVEVPISPTAFGFEPRAATALVIEQSSGRFESGRSLDCPACHGTVTVAVPERAG